MGVCINVYLPGDARLPLSELSSIIEGGPASVTSLLLRISKTPSNDRFVLI